MCQTLALRDKNPWDKILEICLTVGCVLGECFMARHLHIEFLICHIDILFYRNLMMTYYNKLFTFTLSNSEMLDR